MLIIKFKDFKEYVLCDLYRCCGKKSFIWFVKFYLCEAGFKYMFYLRLCKYLNNCRLKKFFRIIYLLNRLILKHYQYKFGIQIPFDTKIGKGYYITHFNCIVINKRTKIGNNCNVCHGVTIGMADRGKNKGCASIGDNVYIGPGAKIVGNVKIGNNVAIGANAVVTKDVPDNAVVVGIPARVISFNGSSGYINNII